MARLLLLPLLLLAGCPHYEAFVEMEVAPDGAVARRMTLRAVEKEDIWACFERPGEPWRVSGDAKAGFVAEARFASPKGTGNGLRQLGLPRSASYEGSLTVEAIDCVVGTLYRYRETLGSGLDPALVARESDRWALWSADLLLKALEIRFPKVDRGALGLHLRGSVAPRAAEAVREALPHAALLVERYRRRDGASPREDPSVPALLAILAQFGPEIPVSLFVQGLDMEALAGRAQGDFARREILPHLPAEARDEVLRVMEKPDEAMEEAFEAAAAAVEPDPAKREKAEQELCRFLDAAIGAGGTKLMFESLELRFSIALPGTLLRTNGDLTDFPRVFWRAGKDDLVLAPTTLFALSFAPHDWAGKGRWNPEELFDAREAFEGLGAEEARADAAARIRKGCEKDFDAAKEGAPEEVARVVERFKSLVTDARSS